MAITVPAANSTGTSAWADDVANQINQMRAFMTLVNPNAASPASGTATWVTMGNITVPTWATRARVSLAMTGVAASTSNTGVDVAVKIGSSTGALWRFTADDSTTRHQCTINDLLTSVPTGSQSVTVQATFSAGILTASSTFCSFGLNIDWMQ